MKSYDEYKLDEEVSLIEEGIANFLKGKLMKDKKVATEDSDGKPTTMNIGADYRATKEGIAKIGSLLTDGKYKEALEEIKNVNNNTFKQLAKNVEKLIDGQKKVGELKGQQAAKKEEDDVDGDELARQQAASVKTTRKMFYY